METPIRTLGLLPLIIGITNVSVLLLLMLLSSVLIPFIIVSKTNPGDMPLSLIPVVNVILGIPIVLAALPLSGGSAVLKKRSRGMTILPVAGCIRLFSFPVGTALGVYTIRIYLESKKTI